LRVLKIVRAVISILALAGIVVSCLALHVHYSTAPQACSINETWDCGLVNHSAYAQIGPLPVAVLGIAGYALIILLAWLPLSLPLFLAAAGGCVFALYLTFIEKFVLMAWCLYCVISQCAILLILLLAFGWFLVEYFQGWRARRRLAQRQ
jgi:vitamin-K-epoxide reductase (warfarin-sensitive)